MIGLLGLIPEIFKPMPVYPYIRSSILFFYVSHSTLGTLLSALYSSRLCSDTQSFSFSLEAAEFSSV